MPSSKRRASGGSTPSSKATTPSSLATKVDNDSPSSSAWHCPTSTPDNKLNLHAAEGSTGHVWSPGDNEFRVTVVSIDEDERCSKALLWMSQAAMVAAGAAVGSLILVYVVPLGGRCVEESGALLCQSLHESCTARCGVEIAHMNVCGKYAAVASTWPLQKLKKNEVKVSRALASTLGSLPLGSVLSLKVLRVQSAADPMEAILKVSSCPEEPASLHDCSHLSLQICFSSDALRSEVTLDRPARISHLPSNSPDVSLASPSRFHGHQEPKSLELTGIAVSRSPAARWSPLLDGGPAEAMRRHEDRSGQSFHANSQSWASIRAIFAVGKENLRNLLEVFATRWIIGRYILLGNLIQIPLLGYDCTFLVTDAGTSPREVHEASDNQTAEPSLKRSLKSDPNKEEAVVKKVPKKVYVVSQSTKTSLLPPILPEDSADTSHEEVSRAFVRPIESAGVAADIDKIEYSALGGLAGEIRKLQQHVELSLLHPGYLTQYGLQPVRGVLLHGPPGTGKSSLARAAACEARVNLFIINGPEVVSEYYGESEASIREVFLSAAKAAPSVIFIDELDAIAPARQDGSEDLGQRMVAELLTLMDGGGTRECKGILVIGATNRIDAIDPALRRPGRFDVEIEIGVPTPLDRLSILKILLQDMRHSLTSADIAELAATTHGYVGADLSALCNEAAMAALRRCVQLRDAKISVDAVLEESFCRLRIGQGRFSKTLESHLEAHISMAESVEASAPERGSHFRISSDDFQEAKTKVRPSAMREVALEVPKVRWSDIGGQEEVKQKLKELVEWPQKQSAAIARMGVEPPRGVLLHGPPGCSKTMMARAVASEAGLNFIAVKGPELFSKWVGESEKAVKSLFNKARASAPSVVFFDEIDGLAVKRDVGEDRGVSVGDRVMSQLLTEMDGLVPMKGVAVIAATNRLDIIDDALLRPGRFDRVLYVGPPDEDSRKQIFGIHLRHVPCCSDVCQSNLALRTSNYTGADISAVCQEATLAALTEDLGAKTVRMCHFDIALERVKPSCDGR